MESPPAFEIPNYRDLTPQQLGFLNEHFTTHNENLKHKVVNLETQLKDSENNLLGLQNKLTKLVVSWISHSVASKHSLRHLNLNLQNLSLLSSQYGIGSKMMQQVINLELSRLSKEVRRVETVRKYAETTLQLEALVGNLEDAVLCIMNWHAKNMFPANLSKASDSAEIGGGHERLFQTVTFMHDIEKVLTEVMKTQPQWNHLVKSVDTRVDKILAVLRPKVLADHRALLASLGWPSNLMTSKVEGGRISELPNPLVLMRQDKREIYSQSFLALCALQHLLTLREGRQLNCSGQKDYNKGLWAIDELVSPIASRTEYHFSKWATDQPEFIFALVYRVTKDFVAGVDDVLQPLIDKARLVSFSAKEAWVFSMVQMVAGFLDKKVFPILADRYKVKNMKSEVISLWLHLVDLIIAFDKRMISILSSEPGRLEGVSRGISVLSIFSQRPEWLKLWAKIELKDAWKKIKVEVKDEKSWLVKKEHGHEINIKEINVQLLSGRVEHRAPSIAESATKIAWDLIERCQTLPTLVMRAQFSRLTAARFFWYFFNVLLHRCKRPELPLDNHDENDDIFIRTCESLNAARYIESKLQEWNDDVNFLEMKMTENNMNGTLQDISDGNICFFGEEMKSLAELETSCLMEIITELLHQFENLSWGYFHNRESFEQEEEELGQSIVSSNVDISMSYDLVQGLDFLRDQLLAIKTRLNAMDFTDLWRSVADGLDHYIISSVLESIIHFSNEGVNQFGVDMKALFHVFRPFCERPEAFFPRTRNTIDLLRLNSKEVMHFQADIENHRISCKISHLSSDLAEKILKMRKSRGRFET